MRATSHSAAFGLSLFLLGASIGAPVHAQTTTEETRPTRDLALEERNRQIVVDFYNGVFNRHEVENSARVLANDYIQHNPGVPDGKAPFVKFFTGHFKESPNARSRIIRSATDGNLVYLHVHSTVDDGDRGRAIVDIFRVENGRIVEHWDVIQSVPATSANKNTMF